MTTVGMVGLGKLGLPIAATLALRGHRVLGFDIDPARMDLDALSHHERSIDGRTTLRDSLPEDLPLSFVPLGALVEGADCVFVAVETPHEPQYDGSTPLPETRADFDYRALERAVRMLSAAAGRSLEIGVMSTVMPGTIRRLILPLTTGHELVYCPQFVAMGTVAGNLTSPEFVLAGGDADAPKLTGVLASVGGGPVHSVSYESAELAKVIYNTFVSAKVAVSNVVQLVAHEVGASAAEVFAVIRSADQRLISGAYIGPGMGDGGPCHPRDNIALSWLARRLGIADDLFSAVMTSRQSYTEWLVDRFVEAGGALPLVVLGTAYKPGTDIVTGSSVALLTAIMRSRGLRVTEVPTPEALDADVLSETPAAYFIGCPEAEFLALRPAPGSVVVDPWHRMPEAGGYRLVRLGEPGTAR